jgi:uncharacterized protein (TIGR03437 family)
MTIPYTRFLLLAAIIASASTGFSQTAAVTSVNAANDRAIVAPDSIASAWGANFSTSTTAGTLTDGSLPVSVGGVQLSLVDNSMTTLTPTLYMVSPTQINYVVPANAALGAGTLTVQSMSGTADGPVLISNVSPGIFTFNGSGTGVPAAQILTYNPDGQVTNTSPAQTGSSTHSPNPIAIGSNQVYIVLYGTGVRRHSLNPVFATVNSISIPVAYAGSQGQYPGLDQLNVGPLPTSLAGAGTTDLIVTVDGVPANSVQLAFK